MNDRWDVELVYNGCSYTGLGLLDHCKSCYVMGPSIYDAHTEGGGGQAQVDACGRGEGGPAPCGRPHRKLKLESTDAILFTSHVKKLASFFTRISSLDRKKWKFFCDIN